MSHNKKVRTAVETIIVVIITIILSINISTLSIHYKNYQETAQLHALIQKDYPALTQEDLTDFEKVNLLRQWAYETTDYGLSNLIDTDPNFEYYQRSAPEIFNKFLADKGGVYCGGSAVALEKLYTSFGFNAYSVDSGFPGHLTHVLTIVEIEHNNKKILTIQDSLFNHTYTDPQNTPLDYFQFLKLLKEEKHSEIKFNRLNQKFPLNKLKDLIVNPNDHPENILLHTEPGSQPIKELPNNALKYIHKYDFAEYKDSFKESILPIITEKGHPAELIYLMYYPINISTTNPSLNENAQKLLQKAKLITSGEQN